MHIKGMIFSFLSFFRSNTKLCISKLMKLHRLQVVTEIVTLELNSVFLLDVAFGFKESHTFFHCYNSDF